MNFIKCTDGGGEGEYYVNLDMIQAVRINRENKTAILKTNCMDYLTDIPTFEKAIAKKDMIDGFSTILQRLVTALDRLTIHIPTSIRLHL